MTDLHPMLAYAFQLSAAGRNAEAMQIVNQLAAQGEPEALWILGDAHWRGNMMPIDYRRGRELMERASDAATRSRRAPAPICSLAALPGFATGRRRLPAWKRRRGTTACARGCSLWPGAWTSTSGAIRAGGRRERC